jgi:uncharacterized 2Fe-2S/4Fe-4S cluster protein (DUF4445 family)
MNLKKIRIISGKTEKLLNNIKGSSLFEIIRDNGYNIYSPCGGKGTCGKCTVYIKGEGIITSCRYYPSTDVEVILPDKRESQILVAQSDYLEEFPLNEINISKLSKNPFGVAIDIGTTTLVFFFVNLLTGEILKIRSLLNPQAVYGSDVISRIHFCQMNSDGLTVLQQTIIQVINDVLVNFRKSSGIGETDIVKLHIVGNNTMLHILLGENPVSLALAPFTPVFTDLQIRTGKSLGLRTHPEAEIKTLPSISAYVGADIVTGIAVLKKYSDIKNILYIDIGTNGEIGLITPDKIYSCATAAGPAFEGANISCGMGAVEGAISVFTSEREIQTIGNLEPIGICGSGIIDIVSYMLDNKIIDETGVLNASFNVLSGSPHKNIEINQKDIREIQLAKSAIYSGLKVLLFRAGLTFNDVDALYLAGGFGNYINIDSAINIGLLPGEIKEKIHAIGNSAGAGALQSLRSVTFDERISKVLSISEYIELSNSDEFTMEYALNMNFKIFQLPNM